MALTNEDLESIIPWLAECSGDPLKFVEEGFDWGIGELAEYEGPDEWQIAILAAVREGLLTVDEAIQIAVASGHGIGKSALVAWLILWALATMEDTKGVVTANTENQLKTKTWAELAKWHRLFIAKDLFQYTATAIFSTDQNHEKTWCWPVILLTLKTGTRLTPYSLTRATVPAWQAQARQWAGSGHWYPLLLNRLTRDT